MDGKLVETLLDYTQPGRGATVNVTLTDSVGGFDAMREYFSSDYVYIEGGGWYEMVQLESVRLKPARWLNSPVVTDGIDATLKNTGIPSNAAPGSTVLASAIAIPSLPQPKNGDRTPS